MSDELTPITRKEIFLAKAGGQNVVTPTPITREEIFLQAIIDNGSGGGGGTGGGGNVMIVTLTYDEDADDGTYTSSASATEIGTANSEGKVVIGKAEGIPFFVSVLDFMGMITINGIQLSEGSGTVNYHLFSMDTTTNKWKDTLL